MSDALGGRSLEHDAAAGVAAPGSRSMIQDAGPRIAKLDFKCA